MIKTIFKITIPIMCIIVLLLMCIIILLPFDLNESQYTGDVYSCIDMKIEYGHINPDNLNQVIESSNELTSRLLTFSPNSEYKSFNQLTFDKETKAHCVYYAKVYKQIFDYIISKGSLKATCKIERKPIKELSFIPKFFKSIGNTKMYNFTKDHDYCVINNSIKVDPTVYDFMH